MNNKEQWEARSIRCLIGFIVVGVIIGCQLAADSEWLSPTVFVVGIFAVGFTISVLKYTES